jgi:hypothetical protein
MRRKEGAGKMTDAQFEKIKKGLIFHSENGVDNLCTLTETALRELLEDATKELEAQIEKMKCCENCKKFVLGKICKTPCIKYDKWEMKENEQK